MASLCRLNPSRVDDIPKYQTFNQYYKLFRVVDHKPQNDPNDPLYLIPNSPRE